jgi:hypothetical protein
MVVRMVVWMCLACLAWPGFAHAQTNPTEPPEYKVLIEQARNEYEAHNFAEARALFLRAHEQFPNARTLRGLGIMEFELRNYGDCVARLSEALASTVRPLDGVLRKETEELLARARTFVARVELETQPPAIRGMRIVVDGEPLASTPDRALTLTVGEHVLLIQVPCYQEERRTLSVKGAEERHLVIQLRLQQPPAPERVTALQPAPPKHDERAVWKSPWLWTGVGAAVIGGAVAGVLLSTRGQKHAPESVSGDIGGVVQTLGAR